LWQTDRRAQFHERLIPRARVTDSLYERARHPLNDSARTSLRHDAFDRKPTRQDALYISIDESLF
jgi:hypothetical protein